MERSQQACVGVIKFEHLPRRTCSWIARSRLLPSSRTGLFAIGERSIPQIVTGEKVLTTTGGGVHHGSFRRPRGGEGIVPAYNARTVGLGIAVSHGPIVVRIRQLTIVICLRYIWGSGGHGI